ncbi:Arp4p [Lachancea thermotolerans CBS 6340]|uniref:Actin-related protein 4 n=1 Tax=Lachancea thermotolerans (strain ATCC 56472 / CBS 6340 / NRRL Y-8284) TaxID=559295 RepID=C5E324_LACTC|nr:KLTH0H09702p [Lachancea thermotolerans CBS 6340]CAR30435.1 KLTH0H09702p [Lachancea thermotolerans CBS 6340]
MSNPALQIYGGDEISAVVIDPGSYSTNIGYSGTDSPQLNIPSCYGQYTAGGKEGQKSFNDQFMIMPRPDFEIKRILENGCVVDWEAAQEQWAWAIRDELKFESFKGTPAFLTEAIWNPEENRKKSLEVLLEGMEFEACYIAPTATCTSFAMGRPTCLVLDIGHDVASVCPVVDGMTLSKSSTRNFLAGKLLNKLIENHLKPRELVPLYKVERKRPEFVPKKFEFTVSKSVDEFANSRGFLQECKETMLHVAAVELPKFQSELETTSKRSIEAPWGENIIFDSNARYSFAEQLFKPTKEMLPSDWPVTKDGVVETWHNDYVPMKRAKPGLGNKDKEGTTESTPAPEEANGETPSATTNENGKRPIEESSKTSDAIAGLADLVNTAITATDVDLRATLAHNLVVTGGSSSIPGLTDRLMTELNKKLPALKFRILTSGHLRERQSRAWLGGSILSSLGTFHQLWVGRQEYEEVGAERLLKDRFR